MRKIIKIYGIIIFLVFAFFACSPDGGGSDNPELISIAAIQGIIPPVAGAIPVTYVETTQYSGNVVWSPVVTGIFAASTTYEATITLTAKEGYTLAGIPANFFTVTGATMLTNNMANGGVVKVEFPVTDPNITIDWAGTVNSYSSGLVYGQFYSGNWLTSVYTNPPSTLIAKIIGVSDADASSLPVASWSTITVATFNIIDGGNFEFSGYIPPASYNRYVLFAFSGNSGSTWYFASADSSGGQITGIIDAGNLGSYCIFVPSE